MYRFKLMPIFITVAIIVVACTSEATPTPEQEEEPTEEPAAVPTEAPAAESVAAGTGDALLDTIWSLTELNGESLILTTNITAEFNEDGRVAGSSGCNNYAAAYEVDGNNITINASPAATTLMACVPPVMEQEAAYMEALEAAETYEVSAPPAGGDEELVLNDSSGNPVAVFSAVSQDLAGSSWDVIAYNNGRGGVVSVIIDTEITANFGEDGELTGNASCNDYFGAYEADGENISMGPFGATRKACQEPEGIMQQESEYLAALETAATYSIDGLTMNMRTADGATVANFRRTRAGGEASVTGAITFADSAALPEDATVAVQIQDTSLADAPATVIGEQIVTEATQFPIPYEVSYDPGQIQDNHTYTMSARITGSDGSLLFINDTAIMVITRGNPTEEVEIPVIQVGG